MRDPGPNEIELRKLLADKIENHGLVNMSVTWGPKAYEMTVEERCRYVIDHVINRDTSNDVPVTASELDRQTLAPHVPAEDWKMLSHDGKRIEMNRAMERRLEELKDQEVVTVIDTLASLMLRHGECYDHDNATLADARAEAEAIVTMALRDKETRSVLNHQIGELQSAVGRLQAENHRLRVAFHDATRRPLGVTPDSGLEFYDPRMADEAERRRTSYGGASSVRGDQRHG